MDRKMGAHPRSRTGSMGDWEALVFREGHAANEQEKQALGLNDIRFAARTGMGGASGQFPLPIKTQGLPSQLAPQLAPQPPPPQIPLTVNDSVSEIQNQDKSEDALEFITPSTSDEDHLDRSRQSTSQSVSESLSRDSHDSRQREEGDSSLSWVQVSLSGITSPLEKISGRPLSAASSSTFSMLTRTPQTQLSPGIRDLPTFESGPGSSAGESFNDRSQPFFSTTERPQSPFYAGNTSEHLESVEHDKEEDRGLSPTNLFDEIGKMTPDLLSSTPVGDVNEIAKSRQRTRTKSSNLSGLGGLEGEAAKMEEDEYDADAQERERENWLPPPTIGRASRFDPKSQLLQADPGRDSLEGDQLPVEDRRRRPGKPKLAARPSSLAHFSSTRRLATTPTSSIHLPAVLVMPAPLDPSNGVRHSLNSRGFVQVEEKPFPADFARPQKIVRSSSFVPSAAALSIPTNRLSLAQKTFRASLVVDGKRATEFLGGALEEGERAFDPTEDGDDEDEALAKQWAARQDDEYRAPGQLYGRSLMEILEERKQALKAKQRLVHRYCFFSILCGLV